MSPRIKAKIPSQRGKFALDGRKILLAVVGIGLAAFIIGYGLTALAFTYGRAPADVVMVPDVRDLPLADARRRMSAQGLQLEIGDSFPNAMIPAGAVLAQTPLPGREVSAGAQVRVVLSTGRPRPTVPDVEAMPIALATRALQTAGFDVLVEEAPGEGQPGRVISVAPAAGTPVELPASVVVRVGAGMPDAIVPPVIGMLEASAREMVEDAGFVVGEVVYEHSEFGEPGGVVAQDPPPGSSVPTGSVVRLRVTFPPGSTFRFDGLRSEGSHDRGQ